MYVTENWGDHYEFIITLLALGSLTEAHLRGDIFLVVLMRGRKIFSGWIFLIILFFTKKDFVGAPWWRSR